MGEENEEINVRDRLCDNLLDLSLLNISTVPVDEIKALRRATILDLSNNRITSIGPDFLALTQITQLDLSKNRITSICDDFGQLTSLRRLDLYNNQITRLPLTFGRLKNLKYLDLKNNPLNPALSKKIGTFSDTNDCLAAASRAVELMNTIEQMMLRDCNEEIAKREAEEKALAKEETPSETGGKGKRKRKQIGTDGEGSSDQKSAAAEVDRQNHKLQQHQKQRQDSGSSSSLLSSILTFVLLLLTGLLLVYSATYSSIVRSLWEDSENLVLEEYIK
uniref:Putative conserved plasma membrane protein n=1 Tax=Anopheles triannulatus TaxID=58253 RepID=A0A2M4ANE4_9DIPT